MLKGFWFFLRPLLFFILLAHLLAVPTHSQEQREFIVKPKASWRSLQDAGFMPHAKAKQDLLISEVATSFSASSKDSDPCQRLLKSGLVEYCEENSPVYALGIPNDAQFNLEWGLSQNNNIDIDAPEAWELTKGSTEVVVAVVDTGVDYLNSDLAPNMWVNPREIAGNGSDDDGNGYIDDIHGINALTLSGDPMDDMGHGTHVAGIIGARGDNGLGISGVNWNVKIIGVKFLSLFGSGTVFDAIRGIDYVTALRQSGINVVLSNNSWGGGIYSQALYQAIERANQANILFVAAAGNSGSDNDDLAHYPSNYPNANVISVAAVDREGNLASFSNYGAYNVHIAAPGVDIQSTYLRGITLPLSGTSMAAPFVSGALALLNAHMPGLSMAEQKGRLLVNGRTLPSLNGLVFSGQLLNVYGLLTGITPPPGISAPPRSTAAFELDNIKGRARAGARYTVSVRGRAGSVGKLRVVARHHRCSLGYFYVREDLAAASFRVPSNSLNGRVKIQALSRLGQIEDSEHLYISSSARGPGVRSWRPMAKASSSEVRSWCRAVWRSLRFL